MPNNTAKWELYRTMIRSYMNAANIPDAQYLRLWNMGLDLVKKLNLDVFNSVKTRKLNVLPNKTVFLPEDCMHWLKIGVLNDRGEVATLMENKDMTLYASLDDNRLNLINDTSNGVTDLSVLKNYYLNFWWNDTYYNLFGVASGSDPMGNFRFDEDNGLFVLTPAFVPTYVILEYIPRIPLDSNLRLPIECGPLMKKFLNWENSAYLPASRKNNLGIRAANRHDFFTELKSMKARINPLKLWIMNDIYRSSLKLSTKA